MLIRFSFENWKSFRSETTFTMAAGKERQHRERVPKPDGQRSGILPVAALYGGNASGKTNFFEAVEFAQRMIVNGFSKDNPIPIEPFQLNKKGPMQPSRFLFELLIDRLVYEFSFTLTREKVLEEKLALLTNGSEKMLYHRRNGKIKFGSHLSKNQFFQFSFKATGKNQLFLNSSVNLNIDEFQPVYNWFKHTLKLVRPNSTFGPITDYLEGSKSATMNDVLSHLDTGITALIGEDVPFTRIPMDEEMKYKLQTLKEGETHHLNYPDEHVVVFRQDGDLLGKRLAASHTMKDGSQIQFSIPRESAGSRRLLELLPIFLELSDPSTQHVCLIDEVDRSLHTLLTRRLIESFLSPCTENSRSQLLFTTHDVLLMDQQFLRRDEMWTAERNEFGASSLFSFGGKDIRSDKDIRKSYLQGMLGGVPRFLIEGVLGNLDSAEESTADD